MVFEIGILVLIVYAAWIATVTLVAWAIDAWIEVLRS